MQTSHIFAVIIDFCFWIHTRGSRVIIAWDVYAAKNQKAAVCSQQVQWWCAAMLVLSFCSSCCQYHGIFLIYYDCRLYGFQICSSSWPVHQSSSSQQSQQGSSLQGSVSFEVSWKTSRDAQQIYDCCRGLDYEHCW